LRGIQLANRTKKNINNKGNDNIGGNKNGDIREKVKKNINERINKRLLFRKKEFAILLRFKRSRFLSRFDT